MCDLCINMPQRELKTVSAENGCRLFVISAKEGNSAEEMFNVIAADMSCCPDVEAVPASSVNDHDKKACLIQ